MVCSYPQMEVQTVLLLSDWQNFYLLTGTAAATLMGLLFVAVSLGTNLPAAQIRDSLRTFVTPILVTYFQVLLLGCVALIPRLSPPFFAGAVALLGLSNAAQAGQVLWRMRVIHRGEVIERGHWIWHFALPFVGALLLLVSAYGFFRAVSLAELGLAITQLLSLTTGLRNTWVLMIWLALRRVEADPTAPTDSYSSPAAPY